MKYNIGDAYPFAPGLVSPMVACDHTLIDGTRVIGLVDETGDHLVLIGSREILTRERKDWDLLTHGAPWEMETHEDI
jgi:hypothetical protein